MSTIKRWLGRKPLALLLLGLLAGGGAYWAASGSAADAAKTIFGYAGSGRAGIAVNLFVPDEVYVEPGDTVEWVNPYEEPHTLTFLVGDDGFEFDEVANVEAAAAFDGSESFSSGFIGKDAQFAVTFSKLGKYTFLCLLHQGMVVDVFVVPAGTTVPPQGANSPENTAIIEAAIATGEAAEAAVEVPAPASLPDGSTNWTVVTGPGVPLPQGSSVDVMKFFAPNLSIAVGDTVTWKDETFVPHTVTFIPEELPAEINPFVPEIPSQDFDGSDYVNSGIISAIPDFGAVTEFSLTFTKVGTYQYLCLLHADQGMVGEIVVGSGAGSGPITPPSTGDGGLIE